MFPSGFYSVRETKGLQWSEAWRGITILKNRTPSKVLAKMIPNNQEIICCFFKDDQCYNCPLSKKCIYFGREKKNNPRNNKNQTYSNYLIRFWWRYCVGFFFPLFFLLCHNVRFSCYRKAKKKSSKNKQKKPQKNKTPNKQTNGTKHPKGKCGTETKQFKINKTKLVLHCFKVDW